ncbi:MAG: Crp/Fnr family transcriptional regulator [Ilumatobacter sp.]|jgi:CRP/FNR family transcriptional regulator, cyclic AMP receptor protein|uniref:Crp/Fnr family transcriptional regulator n=1 Tax=Ilumatobacter sp. TaxID=1967498 RepID=UPI00391DD792
MQVEATQVEPTRLIPADVWATIRELGVARRFEDGDVLLHHGGEGRSCYAIRSGIALVTVTSTQGATLVLGRRGPDTLVGELAALEGAPRSATVTAKSQLDTYRLTSDQLHATLERHPDWAVSLLEHLAGRIRSLTERYALRSEDLRRRVTEVLSTHLEETGDPVFRSSREELAGWVGATREAVIRCLQQMRADGVVLLRRGSVQLVQATPITR